MLERQHFWSGSERVGYLSYRSIPASDIRYVLGCWEGEDIVKELVLWPNTLWCNQKANILDCGAAKLEFGWIENHSIL